VTRTIRPETHPHLPPRRRKGGVLVFLRDLAVIVLIAILASFLIKTFLVRSFYIPSVSMQNTLQVHDRILVNELVPKVMRLQRGDVVVFQDPGGWLEGDVVNPPSTPVVAASEWLLGLVGLSSQDANDHLIKRVIGMPGDHVECCNALGQTSVNGVPLVEKYVRTIPGDESNEDTPFNVVVPKDTIWVEGDNRGESCDSRCRQNTPSKGFVPISDVVGRAFVISWPIGRWTTLSNYPATFDGIPAP
jgi:signal peptidase I